MSRQVAVADVEDVPEGGRLVVRVEGREIGIFNVRGAVYALPNTCPHQNGPLCFGAVTGTMAATARTGWKKAWEHEGEILRCPWHLLEFEITTGRCVGSPQWNLATYEVSVVGGRIVVDLESRARKT